MITKISVYAKLISAAHQAFREYLEHLPEAILDLQVHEMVPTARETIRHTISGQLWLAKLVTNVESSIHVPNANGLTLQDFIELFNKVSADIEKSLSSLNDDTLEQEREYKGYAKTVEVWLFEYIHHLSFHSGQLAQIHTIWKRLPDEDKE